MARRCAWAYRRVVFCVARKGGFHTESTENTEKKTGSVWEFPEGLRRYLLWLYSTESHDSLPLPLVTLWKRLSGRYGRASPEGVEVGPCQLHKIILYGDVSSFRRKRLVFSDNNCQSFPKIGSNNNYWTKLLLSRWTKIVDIMRQAALFSWTIISDNSQ